MPSSPLCSTRLAGALHAARLTKARPEDGANLGPKIDTSLIDQRDDPGSVFIRAVDVTPSLLGHVQGDLRHLGTGHLLQAERLRNRLNDARERATRTTSALVFDGEKRAVLVPLDRVRDALDAQCLTHQGNPMVHDDPSAMVGDPGVHPLMPGRSLDCQVVVRPDAIEKQRSLTWAVRVVLQRREAKPLLLGLDHDRHR